MADRSPSDNQSIHLPTRQMWKRTLIAGGIIAVLFLILLG